MVELRDISGRLNASEFRLGNNTPATSSSVAIEKSPPFSSNVELSPQAKILQQNEALQIERQKRLDAEREENNDTLADSAKNQFVRVSSSVGSAQKNSLTSAQATELYQSIEKLI